MIYDKPLASAYTGDSKLYETCVWLGCVAAKGKSTETDVFNAIWNKFQTMNVTTKDGEQLGYYVGGNNTPLAYTTRDLLKNKDGRCEGWARLFQNVLACQGIKVYLKAFEINKTYVKNKLQDRFNSDEWTIKLQQKGDIFQNNGNPNAKGFSDHIINIYNNCIYDVTCGAGPYNNNADGILDYLRDNTYILCCDENNINPPVIYENNDLTLNFFNIYGVCE